jgi:hypothetical protein
VPRRACGLITVTVERSDAVRFRIRHGPLFGVRFRRSLIARFVLAGLKQTPIDHTIRKV